MTERHLQELGLLPSLTYALSRAACLLPVRLANGLRFVMVALKILLNVDELIPADPLLARGEVHNVLFTARYLLPSC
jgi:hypothetical protein